MGTQRFPLLALLLASSALSSFACGDDGTSPAPEPAAMAIVAGDAQEDTIGAGLAPLVVRVTSAAGAPVPGVPVEFVVTRGFASVTAPMSETDAQGLARADVVLGTVAGDVLIEARPGGGLALEDGPVVFDAAVRPGAAHALSPASGQDQRFLTDARLQETLAVEVRDRGANVLRGAPIPVQWRVSTGGGSVEPQGATTDGAGRASAGWTLGSQAGEQRVEASVAGVPPAVFQAEGVPPGAIAYVTGVNDGHSPFHLELSRPDGGDRVRVYSETTARRYEGVTWSPDGSRVAVSWSDATGGGAGLYVVALDGTPAVTILHGFVSGPAWSPTGEWIAFSQDGDIHLIRPDGSERRSLTQTTESEYHAAWHPDGSALAFTRLLPGAGAGIFLVGVTEGDMGPLVADSARIALEPAWSPDGTRLAYAVGSQGSDPGLFVLDRSDGAVAQVGSGVPLAWSPDGSFLLVRDSPGTQAKLTVVEVATGARQPLETPEPVSAGDWRR